MNLELLRLKLLHVLPHHACARLMGYVVRCRVPAIKNYLIRLFIKTYGVDMSEALEERVEAYANFEAFFQRPLKPNLRPLSPESGALISPADGAMSEFGHIDYGTLIQAKGHQYSVQALLGERTPSDLTEYFQHGEFATIYLSPKDYHRVHMPIDGTLQETCYIPGRLFPVNPLSVSEVPSLFARNERYVSIFDSEYGPFAVILVGAFYVAAIETVFDGRVTPPRYGEILRRNRRTENIVLKRGDEMGLFNLGSTVILLFGKDRLRWDDLNIGQTLRMGEKLGTLI